MRTKIVEILNNNLTNFSELSNDQLCDAFGELISCMISLDEDEMELMNEIGKEMNNRGLLTTCD